MVTASFSSQRRRLAGEVRQRFVADAIKTMGEIVPSVQQRLRTLMDEAAPSREMQARRDAWTEGKWVRDAALAYDAKRRARLVA